MKRLSVIAFLAALGLLFAGCGGGGGSSSVAKGNTGGNSNCPAGQVCTNSAGFTTNTIFTDGEQSTSSISKIVSSATGDVPPTAPSFKRVSGVATAPSVN